MEYVVVVPVVGAETCIAYPSTKYVLNFLFHKVEYWCSTNIVDYIFEKCNGSCVCSECRITDGLKERRPHFGNKNCCGRACSWEGRKPFLLFQYF